jgi:RNA polymerase sigma-70 factor (ECF subfamily)
MPAPVYLTEAVAEQFSSGRNYYGDIDVSLDSFADYAWKIACRHVENSSQERSVVDFTMRLYLRDLYLACGCAYKSDKAWAIFDAHYRKFVADLVRFCYRRGTDSEEVADSVLVSLFFNDRSGQQRIASYDGRSSLATWLRVIVINRAINERTETIMADEETVANIPDAHALANFETRLHADRYAKIFSDSLTQALCRLTLAEQLLLVWRYEENMPLGDLAGLLGIHQSNVTRRLVRLQAKLRESVICTLRSQYQLSPAAIEECLTDAVENPMISVSLAIIVRRTPAPVSDAQTGQPRIA